MSATPQAPAPYTDQPIRTGLPVYTFDNRRLGHVKEIAEGARFFKVDARFRRDYWLSRSQVAYVDNRCVGMLFRADEAELYRLNQPADDGMNLRLDRRLALDRDDLQWRGRFPLS